MDRAGRQFALVGVVRRGFAALPKGRTLPHEDWRRRHHWMLVLLAVNAGGLVAFGLARGLEFAHAVLDGVPVAAFGAAAAFAPGGRKARSIFASSGLLTASAMAVHVSGGYVEAHFHFFVVVMVIALYEDWTPFLVAFAYVVLHHGLAGAISPAAVYNHPDAIAEPWKWAAIHGAFVGAAGVAAVVSWRLNEVLRLSQRRALERARASEEAFRSAFEDAVIGMCVTAVDGTFLKVNRALCQMLGRSETALLMRRWQDVTVPEDVPESLALLDRTLRGEQASLALEKRYRHADGRVVSVALAARLVRDSAGRPLHFVTQIRDVTAERKATDALAHQAMHDALTGLPNRTLVLDRLERALARAERQGTRIGVIFVDIDRFKLINDSLGHERGDQVLTQVAERLRASLRTIDTIGRLGGDEFVVVLDELLDEHAMLELADRLRRALIDPFVLGDDEHFVTGSFGLALGSPGASAADLLRDADVAMYRAKDAGGARCELFDAEMRANAAQRLSLEREIRRGLERDEFQLHYQPIFTLAGGEVGGTEALVRWQHPTRGLLAPGEFVPLAEEMGLIVALGEWVLGEACRQGAEWRRSLGASAPLPVHVNVSARQLALPDLPAVVAETLDRTGLAAADLVLEVTETALVERTRNPTVTLERLRALGVRVALDDFGTGYSSLGYLQRFPIDALKIDRGFVTRLGDASQDPAIVRAILAIAASLDMHVVAEGVETSEQAAALRELGCEAAQGFWLARPLPPAELVGLFCRRRATEPGRSH